MFIGQFRQKGRLAMVFIGQGTESRSLPRAGLSIGEGIYVSTQQKQQHQEQQRRQWCQQHIGNIRSRSQSSPTRSGSRIQGGAPPVLNTCINSSNNTNSTQHHHRSTGRISACTITSRSKRLNRQPKLSNREDARH